MWVRSARSTREALPDERGWVGEEARGDRESSACAEENAKHRTVALAGSILLSPSHWGPTFRNEKSPACEPSLREDRENAEAAARGATTEGTIRLSPLERRQTVIRTRRLLVSASRTRSGQVARTSNSPQPRGMMSPHARRANST
jgi:hypothetical protein